MKFDVRMVSEPDDYFSEAVQRAEELSDLVEILERLFESGLAVGEDGRFNHIRARVASVRGLAIHVFPDDHDPPHFHIVGPDCDAKFAIATGDYISGRIDHRRAALAKWFFKHGGRDKVVAKWTQMHPRAEWPGT